MRGEEETSGPQQLQQGSSFPVSSHLLTSLKSSPSSYFCCKTFLTLQVPSHWSRTRSLRSLWRLGCWASYSDHLPPWASLFAFWNDYFLPPVCLIFCPGSLGLWYMPLWKEAVTGSHSLVWPLFSSGHQWRTIYLICILGSCLFSCPAVSLEGVSLRPASLPVLELDTEKWLSPSESHPGERETQQLHWNFWANWFMKHGPPKITTF